MDKVQISARPGEAFEVRLPANPSTGYAWQVALHPREVSLLDSSFTARVGAQPVAGAGGEQVFRFLASLPGKYDIEMELKRAWEQEAINKRRVEVLVQ
jgi:inhibitor of cysteine peptidase